MIYIIIIILLLFLGKGVMQSSSLKRRKYYMYFGSIIFILLIGLRCIQTGQDTEMYGVIFSNLNGYHSLSSFISDSDFEKNIEYGYAIWQWTIHLLFDYRGFLIFQAMLMIIPFSYVVYKCSDDCRLSLLLYILLSYLTWNMCAGRQAPAVSLTLLSYYFYSHKLYKKALVAYLVAISFHTTALILLPAVIGLRFIKNDKLLVVVLVVAKAVGSVILPLLLPYMRIDYSDDVGKESVGQLTYFGFMSLLLLMLYIKKKKNIELPDTFYMFSYMMILWPLVDTLAAAFRITFYFMIYLCFAFPTVITSLRLKREKSMLKVLKICSVCMLSVYFYNMHYGNLGRHVYPYYSVFEYSDATTQRLYKD